MKSARQLHGNNVAHASIEQQINMSHVLITSIVG